jgi:hypothetical protein
VPYARIDLNRELMLRGGYGALLLLLRRPGLVVTEILL